MQYVSYKISGLKLYLMLDIFRKNNKNIIRAMLAGYIAAFVFVLAAFGIKSIPAEETADEKAVEESVPRKDFNYSRPSSSLKDISAEEDDDAFVPSADKLNLAYFFPEDADTSDSINSYAGKIYTSMNAKNAEYFASYFDLTDSTPRSLAAQYGLGADRVMGKYNPNDPAQSADDPSTWTVNSFRNINVSFYDGDGSRISGYYNVQEIMSLASVYAYYHEMDDYEAMQAYCEALFGSAVTAKVSLGSVYYDSGCLNRTVEQEASEAIALEGAQAQLEGGTSVSVSQNGQTSAESRQEYTTIHYDESESASHGYAVANGDLSMVRPAESSTSAAAGGQDSYAEQSSAVIYDYTTAETGTNAASGSSGTGGSSKNSSWQKIHDNVVVSPGSTTAAPTEAPTEAPTSAGGGDAGVSSQSETAADAVVVGDAGSASTADADGRVYMNGAAGRNIFDSVVVSPAEGGQNETASSASSEKSGTDAAGTSDTGTSAAEEHRSTAETAAASQTASASAADQGSTQTVTESYCPGHIDLYVSITIKGIDDSNGLFKADPIGNDEANFNDEWQGWTDDKIALAKALYEQDWFENYGLSISSIRVTNSLTSEEIQGYINSLPPDISDMRKSVVEYALNSVGKIPYYWGGKPSGPGYANNAFYTLISADYRGRILKGLDCSGWINWVYWSVTGQRLAGESTGTLIGCGRRIQRSELKPGDIIIRTGADAHVVMFLCWAQNGNFIGIHETGGVINNVVVSEMTASWPYYRALID